MKHLLRADTMNTIVTYTHSGSVATIAMDDGKANAISLRMLGELNRALDQAETDKATVVLTGRPGMFSGGFDLSVLKAGGPDATNMVKGGFELAARLLAFPTPVVVACTGHAVAMGCFLVLSADYRIGVEGSFKIGANEVAIGLTMPYFAIELCRERLAPSHFNRALLTSEFFTPQDATLAGFLDNVVPAGVVQSTAHSKALELSQLNPAVYFATKLRVRERALTAIRDAIERDSKSALLS
jgi:enoyl-CoA hydratase